MNKVKNKKVIRRIADKTRIAQKGRNVIAVLAIALTAIMFTSVFTVGGSLAKKSQESTMRQVGGSAHAGYKYLTQKEYEVVKKDKKIKEISFRILVGDAVNESLKKLQTEVNYFEELDAKFCFCYPVKGHLPQEEDEVATSDLVLKALGVKCQLGEKVPLVIKMGDRTVEKTFTLSGYFTGDPVAQAQMIAVSRKYQEKIAPVPTTSVMDKEILEGDYTGRIMADFNFGTSLMLDKQVAALSRRCGFPENQYVGINWAYMGQNLDVESLVLLSVLLFIILVSGYLIIYNIFYINVFQDIAHYGLLKTIGTTGKQLRKIVRRQAYMLSLYGIPLGLLVGAVTGRLLLPMVMGQLVYAESVDTSVVLNGWIFAGAALFSFGTVYISCIKPCRIASRVMAIEAVSYTEGQSEIGSGKEKRKKTRRKNTQGIVARKGQKAAVRRGTKRTRKVTPRSMAVGNIRRNRKKVVIVVASLSLALVLLNSIYSLVSGFDMDKYLSKMVVSDFSVQDATLDNFSVDIKSVNMEGVTPAFLNGLEVQKGITEIGNIYAKQMLEMKFTDPDYARLEKRIFENPDAQEKLNLYTQGMEPDYLETVRKKRYIDGIVYGAGKLVMEKLEEPEGSLDWEKFSTGKYVIATRFGYLDDDEPDINFLLPGEKVTIFNEQGEKRKYEVLAVANMPYSCGYKSFGMFDCNYILPEEEYLDFMGEQQPMRTLFNVEEDCEEQVEQWLSSYCSKENPDLDYTSKGKIEKEFDSYKNVIVMVGNLLSLILALIGILNFINTMVTSVLSRKRELAMMEAVGMTGAQLKQMLCFEGGYYAAWTGLFSIFLGSVLNLTVIRSLGEGFFFFTWKFTIAPIILCIPVLLLVVVVVPMVCYRKMCQISVVERIQRVE